MPQNSIWIMIACHIADLLFDHECVVVPGLGGFIKSFSPATIRIDASQMYPPSGKVAFNAGLSANDGLLANYIATAENTTYREALYSISSWVEQCHIQLKSGNTLKLGGIGELFINSSGKLEFAPDLIANFNADAFGLPVLHIKTLSTDIHIANTVQERPLKGKQSKIVQWLPATLKWAAVLAPFVAFTLWGSFNQKTVGNYVQNYSGMFSWVRVTPGKTASIDLASYKQKINPAKKSIESPASMLAVAGSLESPAAISYNQLEKNNIQITPSVEVPLSKNALTDYHIIGGAFRDYNNAMSLITHLKAQGYDAAIVDTTAKGLFMVSIKGVSTYADAQMQLREIKKAGYSAAWLFKLRKS